MTVVDLHSHFFPEQWPDLEARFGTPNWPSMRRDSPDTAMVMMGSKEFRPITSACWDGAVRIADMDRDGVDVQVISATPVLFAYQRPAAHAMECARIFNDALLELCAHNPARLVPLCQVPLQDTDLACRELERALASGHKGVQIGNHVGDRDLDDEQIITFL
jgi:aminocarboxymuconate-semialdehyde decarboxylase